MRTPAWGGENYPHHVYPMPTPITIHPMPMPIEHFKHSVQAQRDEQLRQDGGNPVAIISGIMTGAKVVDGITRVAKSATRNNDAINAKYGETGGNKLVRFGRWASGKLKQIGWGPNGEPVYETQEQLTERKLQQAEGRWITQANQLDY